MKLWVDDEREPPDSTWLIARGYQAAIDVLGVWPGMVSELSLDHDLGEGHDGHDIISFIENRLLIYGFAAPSKMACHSANPVGRKRIEQAIAAIGRAAPVRNSSTSTSVTVGRTF